MTISGMTGFGRAEGSHSGTRWIWETRSVNARGLDLRIRLPQGWDALEPAVRKAVQARFSRGSFNLTLQTRPAEDSAPEVRINHGLLAAYMEAMAPYGLDGQADRPRIEGLLSLPGVLSGAVEPDEAARAALQAEILAGLDAALRQLEAARAEEGAANSAALSDILGRIGALTVGAADAAATQPEQIRTRLLERLGDLLEGQAVEPGRLAQEAALLAAKADVREELDRLRAHVDSGRGLLAEGSPCGRKLDFLAQEFNREANTLCSKSADLELTRIGLELKGAIEQLREHIQNVE